MWELQLTKRVPKKNFDGPSSCTDPNAAKRLRADRAATSVRVRVEKKGVLRRVRSGIFGLATNIDHLDALGGSSAGALSRLLGRA